MLAELLLARGAPVTRSELVDAVWGEAPPESAATSLQVYVHGLRKTLGAERIETHGQSYRLPIGPDELDAERFERLVGRARAALADGSAEAAAHDLRAALALFAGAPLADLDGLPVAARAAELEERRLQAIELRNEAELALGRHEELLAELEPLVREHPYRERFRAQLVLALYRCGRQKEALEAYRDARRLLVDELGVEPGPELRELERAVLRHDESLAAPARAAAGEARLPAPPTPLVGRRLEVAAVAALLRRDDARLVTLTGAGGSGKTRLAIAAAAELARELPGGAVFVDLAAAADAAALGRGVAAALGADAGADDPVAAAAERIGAQPLLLVLDNLEQLLPHVTPVAALLASAPRLRVLATSRAPLRLSGEHEYPVPPLAVPPPSAGFDETAESDAVRLFLARARAVDPGFALTDENAAAVAAICRRLDGLPLALELAAARVRLLPPAELERRLGGALALLVEGARDLPPRQQTLRATLDWSYGLLGEAERAALQRLAVFSGGAELDAVQAVLGADGLARAATLVEHGLARRADGGRLVLLETIREYALERLRESGGEAEARRLHAAWFHGLVERLQPEIGGANIERALPHLDRDYENLLAALDASAASGDVETEVRLAVGLRLYWAVRGAFGEGRRLFERAIADSAGDDELHAHALLHGAAFAFRLGDLAAAAAEWEEALELCRRLGDEEEQARCLAELGGVALAEGDLDTAEERYREAAAAFAAQGRALREAAALGNLAAIAAERQDWARAGEAGERVIALQRSLDDTDGLAVSLHNLARVRLAQGRLDEARALAAESLESSLGLGYREVIAYDLGTLAELALAEGDPERGALLLGRADALFAELEIVRYGEEAAAYERASARLEELLGAARFRDLRDAGAAAELELEPAR